MTDFQPRPALPAGSPLATPQPASSQVMNSSVMTSQTPDTSPPLSELQMSEWRAAGHLTVPGIFTDEQINAATADIETWGREFLAAMSPDQRAWYLERASAGQPLLRKLDHAVALRPVFRELAAEPRLIRRVEQLIGGGLRVWFSQVFLKPARVGGPKPVHQDNFYFGPSRPDGMVTVWIALDDATIENGCLWYANRSHLGPILPHTAPPDEPFNLQVLPDAAAQHAMTPAPVPRGGVSFHHGGTLHQSGENHSDKPRRAIAMHFVNQDTTFESPRLNYDASLVVVITDK